MFDHLKKLHFVAVGYVIAVLTRVLAVAHSEDFMMLSCVDR